MERKEIRRILKRWINREDTDYNSLYYTFVDVMIGKVKMNKLFESLVDKVYNMQRKEEKDGISTKKS